MMRGSAAPVAILLGVLLSGCSDQSVSIVELAELRDLRDVHVTLAPEVVRVGGGEARSGIASDKGERVYFAVVVGETPPRRVTVRGRSYRLVSGCAGAGFYAERERFSTVAFRVETAVYDKLAPDAYCEG